MRKKVFIVVLFLVFASFAESAFATSTRDMGMGLYEQPWFIDGLQTEIYYNPAQLDRFKDTAYAERIGDVDGENTGGIIYNPVGKLTFGLLFGFPVDNSVWNTSGTGSLFHVDTYSAKARPVALSSQGQTLGPYQAEMINGNIIDLSDPADASAPITSGTNAGITSPELREQLKQRNFSIMAAYDFGKFLLGLNFSYATCWNNNRDSDSGIDTNEEYNLINSEYSTAIGGTVKLNEFVSIDAAVSMTLYGLDNNYSKSEPGIDTKMKYKSSNAMDFGGMGRVNYQMTNTHLMHLRLKYAMLNRSSEGSLFITDDNLPANNVDSKDKFDRTGQAVELGVSDEFILPNSVRAFLGFNCAYEAFKHDYSGEDAISPANNVDTYTSDNNSVVLSLIVGMEGKLSTNWEGRFGIAQIMYKPVTNEGTNVVGQGASEQPTSTSEVGSSETAFSMGLSYNIGNFTVDWLANIDLFTVGPYFASGKGTTSQANPMAMAFAVTYHFNAEAAAGNKSLSLP